MSLSKLLAIALISFFSVSVPGQSLSFERDRHKMILSRVKSDLVKNYYDPEFKKVDVELKYQEAIENIKNANSVGQMSSSVAQFLAEFDDSHLFYLPPQKANTVDYGIDFRMAGDKCLVTHIDKGSDAEKKGLQVGDQLRAISGLGPTRETLWKIRYFFYALFPQPELKLAVIKPDGAAVEYVIVPKISSRPRITRFDINEAIRESVRDYNNATKQYFHDKLEGVVIWKMPSFSLDPQKVDSTINNLRKSPAILFDLRGNGGGRVDMVLRLIGSLFDKDVKIGDEKTRKGSNEVVAKTIGKDAYAGKIVVLIDSESASASEVFAKVIQLERRGTVIGERSAGAVMKSRQFGHQLGDAIVFSFGTSVTIADLVMTDGKSLEKIGVTPDITLTPTPRDLASNRDPVLSTALRTLGVEVSPESAFEIFAHTLDRP
ncbi:MAG: S41 family peptidase [Pyrinomonadaceae bacterium]